MLSEMQSQIVRDTRLSLREKGLMLWIDATSDTVLTAEAITEANPTETIQEVRLALNRLYQCGYLNRPPGDKYVRASAS